MFTPRKMVQGAVASLSSPHTRWQTGEDREVDLPKSDACQRNRATRQDGLRLSPVSCPARAHVTCYLGGNSPIGSEFAAVLEVSLIGSVGEFGFLFSV